MRYFEDVEVGEVIETPARTITEADVVKFAAISGDHAALERKGRGLGASLLVPELLVVAITSGLGFRTPVPTPPVLAFMVFDWRYVAPVHVGDTLHCRIRITGKRPMREGGILVEKREMINQRDEVVQEAEYKLMVARRPNYPPTGAVGGGVPTTPPPGRDAHAHRSDLPPGPPRSPSGGGLTSASTRE